MRIEFEIEKRDLDDYDKINEMQACLKEMSQEISESSQLIMGYSISRMNLLFDSMKEQWISRQKDHVGKLLSEHINPSQILQEDE
jgi:hypothetical protein